MAGIDLRGAVLHGTCFLCCNLRGAQFGGADLSTPPETYWLAIAQSHCALIDGCEMHGACFAGCKLEGALLPDAPRYINVRGATYNSLNRWPDGFDPAAHGARGGEHP